MLKWQGWLGIFASLLFLTPARSEDIKKARPLPDPAEFISQVKKRLLTNNELVRDYVYRVKVQDTGMGLNLREEYEIYHFKKCPECSGDTNLNAVQYYVYPFKNHTYEKLIHGDRPPEITDPQDKDDAKMGHGISIKLGSGEPEDRKNLTEAEELRQAQKDVDEVFSVFNIRPVGRESLDGHPAVIVHFTPKKGVKPKGRLAKFVKGMEVKAWIEEDEHEIMRIEARALENISVGVGPLAKIEKGAEFFQERRKIKDEVWLPSRTESNYKFRIFIMPGFKVREVEEYYDYRKFTVGAKIKYEAPN